MRQPYIDVRGPWPILVMGVRAMVLEGRSWSITVAEALRHIEVLAMNEND